MTYICRKLSAAGVALLMMGAGSSAPIVVNSGPTNSIGSVSTSLSGAPTGSIATKTTATLLTSPIGSIKSKAVLNSHSSVTSSLTSSSTRSVISKGTPTSSLVVLSLHAEALAKSLKFDRRVFIIVKEETQENIHRLIGYDENDYQIMAPGISVSVPREKTDRIVSSLRKRLVPLEYIPFVIDKNTGLKIDTIGIIKGTDQYEILRIMHTDSEEDDISNQDVIDRLKEWEKTASFSIIGAGTYWVEIEFKTLPRNLKSFAEDVSDFSPDTLDQGAGNIQGLIREIRKTNRLHVLWE